ncbi:polysaccharide deacetylase family protein [Deinococcus hopiensis]|uniref:Predicted xylanase/chitin deacetylase n=1 Tax=Deinococcus hopiensis KR-140 TaxID=695939 RepID=A0A1W1VL72_9DEIO|nr:polysaccharide deacetylase family protein [Deinococcus hopiensis]SMB94078.1 Predicted xylanase/chitin deacetylase [Deinococcus hopiensis KR-140]
MCAFRWVLAFLLILIFACEAEAGNVTLVYHQIGGHGGVTLGMSADALRKRVQALRTQGYIFVTSSEVMGYPRPVKTATFRFDDGFESVYREAFPTLRELGVRGTVYPILDLIGRPGHMTQTQLDELRAAGWEIGSHTRTHAALVDLTPGRLTWELEPGDGSMPCVAYPFYLQDARVRRAARHSFRCGAGGAFGVRGEAYALPGPLASPWDDWLLPIRARSGLDLRLPVLLGLGANVLLPSSGEAASPRFWNPAAYELLGSGAMGLRWEGGVRDTRLLVRQGRAVMGVNVLRGRETYTGATLAYNLDPVTVAVGYGTQGPVGAVSVALGGYGEVWGRYAGGQVTVGTELLPLNYLRLKAEYTVAASGGARGEAQYALPVMTGEGRPLRLLLGYDAGWYVGGTVRMGAHSASVTSRLDRISFGVRVGTVW